MGTALRGTWHRVLPLWRLKPLLTPTYYVWPRGTVVKRPAQTALLELMTLGGGQMVSGLTQEGAAQVDGYEDSAVPK